MLEELAKADKLEQMNQHRRRMKLLRHKEKVEELWKLKKQKILNESEEREKERLFEKRIRLEQEELIERQKQLLVEKHLPFIKGFCSNKLLDLGYKEKNQKNNRHFGNDIFGVSQDKIEKWEREKENRSNN